MIFFLICILSQGTCLESPLFISLGANCVPANRLRDLNLRQAAFPFDWILSIDDAGLIELINRDFEDFVSGRYFYKDSDGNLKHTLYHLEILYDHEQKEPFRKDSFYPKDEILAKYQRRLERLKEIANFGGKVCFIRFVLPSRLYKAAYPAAYWFDYSHEINERIVALELRDSLKRRFPLLDFDLIVVSKTDGEERMERVEEVRLFYLLDEYNLQSWKGIFDQVMDSLEIFLDGYIFRPRDFYSTGDDQPIAGTAFSRGVRSDNLVSEFL